MGALTTGNERSSPSSANASTAVYLSNFDYPRVAIKPIKEVMIATTPRSGSTYVCMQFWRTGVLGAPLEYANFRLLDRIPRWSSLLHEKNVYWDEVRAVRTSPNGVYGYKFFVQAYSSLLKDAPGLLPLIAPTHVIYLTREDILGQAISYHRAVQSGAWFAGTPHKDRGVPFCKEKIKERFNAIRRQRLRWEYVFAQTGADVLRITYEEMLRCPEHCIARVIQHVHGKPVKRNSLEIPELGIQRDEQSETWKAMLQDAAEKWSAEELSFRDT